MIEKGCKLGPYAKYMHVQNLLGNFKLRLTHLSDFDVLYAVVWLKGYAQHLMKLKREQEKLSRVGG